MDSHLLGPLDEQLNHQTSTVFRIPGTTDHRFYDRHWLEAISPDGETAMIAGLGIYKNMGVCDGFVTVQRGLRQTNVRSSRPLDNDLRASTGPLTIDVLEPFERLRVRLAPGDYPVSCDLEWRSTHPPYLEAPHRDVRMGRVVTDTSRYDQSGEWTGWIELDGERHEHTGWWGVRDHSWGVRSDVGGFEPTQGHTRETLLWNWVYATTDEHVVHLQHREDAHGRLRHLDGVVIRNGVTTEVVKVEHDIDFVPGSRDWHRLVYTLHLPSGPPVVVKAEALGGPWAYRGTGYESGFHDRKGVGVPRGTIVETDVLDLSVPGKVTCEGESYWPGHREQPSRVVVDGHSGTGHIMVLTSGHIPRYNLGKP